MNRFLIQTLILLQVYVFSLVPSFGDDPISVTVDPTSSDEVDWVRTGQSRYSWNWLAERFDSNRDGAVTQSEFPMSARILARIDRTWDGKLTKQDFEWQKDGSLGKQKETTFALFKSADKDSDGRIDSEEWRALFENSSKNSGYINEEVLEQLIYKPRVIKSEKENSLRKGRTEYSPSRLSAHPVPLPGDEAPDFELTSPDKQSTVRLSSFRGKKAVVLVFGCYSCGNYRTYSDSIEKLYQVWKDEAEFLRVYVREAHPVAADQPATSTNAKAGILIKQPSTFEERCSVATKFTDSLNITTPIVVDQIDNSVGEAYGGWPDRLYIVDRDGRIAFTGGPGPFGFNPGEMEQSLALLLLDQRAKP